MKVKVPLREIPCASKREVAGAARYGAASRVSVTGARATFTRGAGWTLRNANGDAVTVTTATKTMAAFTDSSMIPSFSPIAAAAMINDRRGHIRMPAANASRHV